jgi:hypothetical protein
MKIRFLVMLMVIVLTSTQFVFSQSEKKAESSPAASIEVYYFHFERRCITCNAVEDVSKEAILKYGDAVRFYSVNLDEKEGEAIGDRLKVSGQSLLIVNKKDKINLTNEGFMYAKNNPDKLTKLVQEKIDKMIKSDK